MTSKVETISVSVTRTFGHTVLTVGHTAEYEIDGRDKRNSVYQGVMAMLQKQVEEFSRDGLNAPPPQQVLGDVTTEVFKDGHFTGRMENGEVLVRWTGAKYSQWGVPIYDEVVSQLPYHPTEYLQKGGVDAKGYTVHIESENGKVKRVSKVIAP